MSISTAVFCLAINIYHEARYEPQIGQEAVAHVTLNRARLRQQSVCHVVFAPRQFSWTIGALDEKNHLKPEWRPKPGDKLWKHSIEVAKQITAIPQFDFTLGAEYFYADYIPAPKWSVGKVFVGKYGRHLFFREPEDYEMKGESYAQR